MPRLNWTDQDTMLLRGMGIQVEGDIWQPRGMRPAPVTEQRPGPASFASFGGECAEEDIEEAWRRERAMVQVLGEQLNDRIQDLDRERRKRVATIAIAVCALLWTAATLWWVLL